MPIGPALRRQVRFIEVECGEQPVSGERDDVRWSDHHVHDVGRFGLVGIQAELDEPNVEVLHEQLGEIADLVVVDADDDVDGGPKPATSS